MDDITPPTVAWPTWLDTPLTLLRQADPVLGLAAMVLLAVVAANALRNVLGLPRAAGYMLVGALASPAALGWLERTDLDPWKPLIDLAVAVLVFELGSRLRPRWLIDNPWLAASAVLEGLLAAVAVGAALVWLGAPPLAATLAAAASASTSPLVTMAVVNEARPRGQVSERLLMMCALNSVLAVLALKLWPLLVAATPEAAPVNLWVAVPSALRVLCGSFLLGLACAWALDQASRQPGLDSARPGSDAAATTVLHLALVVLAGWLAVAWNLSPLMTLLVAGMAARARMRHRLAVQPQLGSAGAALGVLLFISLGLLSTTQDWRALWPWVLAIIGARLLGKAVAVALLARPSGLGWRQAGALAVGLQPMSSLAVLLAAPSFALADALPGADATVLQALLVATTLMQLTGPLWSQAALRHLAGECPPEPANHRRHREGAAHVA